MVNSHGRFVWYELMTTDPKAAEIFYAEVVGWGTVDASIGGIPYMVFTAGEASVCGLMNLPEEARRMGAAPRWIGYVGVDNVDAAVERIRRLGGVVHLPPTDVPNISRFAVVADPQMAAFALSQWPRPGQEQPAALKTPRCIGWHELLAADWEKAFSFYGELFGWQKARRRTRTPSPSRPRVVHASRCSAAFSARRVALDRVSATGTTQTLPFVGRQLPQNG